ncbi:MAG: DUF559 domain-containing protein [Planctomycetaceae bacterium]
MGLPIGELASGKVRCIFTRDPKVACAVLEQVAGDGNGGLRLVSVQPVLGDGAEKLTAQFTRSLAEAAHLLWPDWYDGSMSFDFDAEPAVRPAIVQLATRQMLRRRRGVNAEWLAAAWHACQSGRAPFMPELSLSLQAEQLSLALAAEDLLFAVILSEAGASDRALLAFSRAVEWLARETDAKVIVLAPESLRTRRELDGISSLATEFEATTCGSLISAEADALRENPDGGEEFKHVVCPIIGRPHPKSPGEQRLAARLTADPELAGLFRFNERVTTTFKSRYLADLVWPSGRVIVEVDGYGFHSSPAAFNADRYRDYELTLSGYLVLRLPHDGVVADVDLAVERIREFVSFRTRYPFIESKVTT